MGIENRPCGRAVSNTPMRVLVAIAVGRFCSRVTSVCAGTVELVTAIIFILSVLPSISINLFSTKTLSVSRLKKMEGSPSSLAMRGVLVANFCSFGLEVT